jgi:uncharacterized membrane protein YkoI
MMLKGLSGCVLIADVLAGTAVSAQEREIPLAEVPDVAIVAAEAAVAGLQISSAEAETEGGQLPYVIEGTAEGVEYEVEVTAQGEVVEVETDD